MHPAFVAGARVFLWSRIDGEIYVIVKSVGLEGLLGVLKYEIVGVGRFTLRSLRR